MIRALPLVLALAWSCQADKPAVVAAQSEALERARPVAAQTLLMLGEGPVYLALLPTPDEARDHQIVLETVLLKTGSDPTSIYAQDRHVTDEKTYTLVTEPLVIDDLIAPASSPTRTSFRAQLVRGLAGRGGQPFLENVTVKVKRVVLARKIQVSSKTGDHLQYFAFGDARQLYAAHVLQTPRDFDQVVAIRVTRGVMDEGQAERMRRGAVIELPEVANEIGQTLKEGATGAGRVVLEQKRALVGFDVTNSIYLDAGSAPF
jgi:hypothetical protein